MDIRNKLITAGALAMALIVLLVAYFVLAPAQRGDPDEAPTLGETYGVAYEEVTRATFAYADEALPTISIERRGGGWRLVEPLDAPAATQKVEDILRVLDRDIRKQVSGDQSEFGFDAPRVAMTVETSAGSKTFLFGNKGVSYALYVKERADRGALIMESWILDEIVKTPAELRDRRVFHLDLPDQVGFQAWAAASGVAAVKDETTREWRVTLPREVPADQSAVEKTVAALTNLTALAFLEDGVDDPGWRGDAMPPKGGEVWLRSEDGSYVRLHVERLKPEGDTVRVFDPQRRSVYKVAADFVAALPMGSYSWINMRIADFQRTETTRVEVERPNGERIILTRNGETWRIAEPRELLADADHMDELLFRLDAAEATRWLDIADAAAAPRVKHGLDAPRLTLRLLGRNAVTVAFGDSTDGGVAVRSSGSPIVGLLPETDVDGWFAPLPTFRDRTLLDYEPVDARRMEFVRGEETLAVARQGVVWRIDRPILEPADRAVVEGVNLALNGLRVERFLPNAPSRSESGLDNPRLSLSIVFKTMRRETLRFGKATDEGVYGELEGDPDVFLISKELFDQLNLTLEDARFRATES